MEKTNYIIHLNTAFEKICNDDRLTPFHISLYFSLFQYWNIAKFRNPISISRDEMMRAAKIGSVNTYIRSIKELDAWQYIQYKPSFNPQKGSQVYLYTFDKATNKPNTKAYSNEPDIPADNSTKKATKKTTAQTPETQLSPSINSLNNTNKLNSKNDHAHTRKKINPKSDLVVTKLFVNQVPEKKEKLREKKKVSLSSGEGRKGEANARSKRPLLETIRSYFASKDWPTVESEKFFNYYQSNGWLVGGKTPMRSWKACASNWMLNSEKFSNGKEKLKPGKLTTGSDKNYSEPL